MEIVPVRDFYSLLEVLRNQKSQGVLDNLVDEDDEMHFLSPHSASPLVGATVSLWK